MTDEQKLFVFGSVAYQGYLIRYNAMNGLIWVAKDGQTILHSAENLRAAKAVIDELTD